MEILCSQCKKSFEREKSSIHKTNFCSLKCKGKYASENLIGSKAAHWKGGWKHAEGYIVEGKKLQHRRVMEEHLGRELTAKEHVHHLNGIKDDNRIENLEVIDIRVHGRLHGSQHGLKYLQSNSIKKSKCAGNH